VRTILAVDGFVDFLSMHRDILGGIDAEPYLVASNFDNCHGDVVVNHDGFVFFPGQY
jgi:hypothetical protein